MILFKNAIDITHYLNEINIANKNTGFIPTMGALHEGHISLIKESKLLGLVTIASIFVNPTQFNDINDFNKYPITIEKDIDLLEQNGCDIVFIPSVEDMYPFGLNTNKTYPLGYLETILEGEFRPSHFQGVCKVVHRLIDIIPANHLFLGQKDFQQCMIIKKLVEIENLGINLIICPTHRETTGLAMSSRNVHLSENDQKLASEIFKTIQFVKTNFKAGDCLALKNKAKEQLTEKGFIVEYVEIADAGNLSILNDWDGNTQSVVLVAAFLNKVRLIDNMIL